MRWGDVIYSSSLFSNPTNTSNVTFVGFSSRMISVVPTIKPSPSPLTDISDAMFITVPGNYILEFSSPGNLVSTNTYEKDKDYTPATYDKYKYKITTGTDNSTITLTSKTNSSNTFTILGGQIMYDIISFYTSPLTEDPVGYSSGGLLNSNCPEASNLDDLIVPNDENMGWTGGLTNCTTACNNNTACKGFDYNPNNSGGKCQLLQGVPTRTEADYTTTTSAGKKCYFRNAPAAAPQIPIGKTIVPQDGQAGQLVNGVMLWNVPRA